MQNKVLSHSLFSEYDIFLFKSGKHFKLYEKLGSHQVEVDGQKGTYFSVYAPAARSIQVIGNFNEWQGQGYELNVRWDNSGIWEGFIPDVERGELYKYKILSHYDNTVREKSDPYGQLFEMAPRTSSITWDTWHEWKDHEWMTKREQFNPYNSPVSIYELHLGSWKKKTEDGTSLSYLEMAKELVTYVLEMGYTHVELMPVTEHPYYPSWGYLSTGLFAPTSRYGSPQEFMVLVEALHIAGIGVLVDWVPAHFPSDISWLADFDGSKVYEHPNPKKGFHPDWNSLIFNYERPEVRSFLISSAHFWFERYHIDGLRVDAVASMLYLDYSREEGEWDPNEYGSNENLAAISFLKDLNLSCYSSFSGIMMIAEESTSFSGVTRPVDQGGLGFGFKWMMGWMNDTLRYMERETVHRQHHHNEVSFSMAYAYTESFVLPLSHDEVVHGKGSLVNKMPGDDWQKFANIRLMFSYMYTHPGHKLLFMGDDLGQTSEWSVDEGVPWYLLDHLPHKGIQLMVKELNQLYKKEDALHRYSFEPKGFQWIDHSDHANSVLSYVRHGSDGEMILVVCNFTPSIQDSYRVGVPLKGKWKEIFNSDNKKYWGSGEHLNKVIESENVSAHGQGDSLSIKLSPLAVTLLKFKN